MLSSLNFVEAIKRTAIAEGHGINPATIPVVNGLENLELATSVSVTNEYQWNYGLWKDNIKDEKYENFPIVCLDFGIKHNILRNFK